MERKALVISPHLDDAVFGCGEWIAAHPGARVLTVFAGVPSEPGALTEWDAACGFASAGEAVAARRAEDRAALELLGATPAWLTFCDDQYRAPADGRAVAGELRRALIEHDPDAVVVPFGLFHRDHRLAHQAALLALQEHAQRSWYAYEDALYRCIPRFLQERLRELSMSGIAATPTPPQAERVDGARLKRRAVQCYASQLRGLSSPGRPGHVDALSPERLWRLTRQ
jgi:LmbE family N-acetylglucosaminyl deacetylase